MDFSTDETLVPLCWDYCFSLHSHINLHWVHTKVRRQIHRVEECIFLKFALPTTAWILERKACVITAILL